MKNILKVIVALGVFTMTIGSSFAMDTNPPTEPVKTTVETEVVTNNMEQPTPFKEGYGYKDALGNCVLITEGSPGTDCSINNFGVICTESVLGVNQNLYYMSRPTEHDNWICGNLLQKPLEN